MWTPSQEQAAQGHQASAPGGITSFLLKTFVIAALALIALGFLAGRGIIDEKYDPRTLLEKNITADDIPKAKAQAQTVIKNITQGPEHTPLPELKQHMLDLTNAERRKAGAPPVRMGSNPAAQLHAEAALEGCYSSHWDRWGMKPNWRYTLTGGTGAEGENVSGSDYCIKASENYRSNEGRMLLEVSETVKGWMDSPGHRKTLLDPAYTILNIGIAFDDYNEVMVQQFSSDYVSYMAKPSVSPTGILTFGGTVQEATLTIGDSVNFMITWHPPPQPLTRGQLAHTYSLCNDQTIGLLRKPLSGGSFYNESASIKTIPVECINPYDNDSDLKGPGSAAEAHKAWTNAKAASQNSTAARTQVLERITASGWNIQAHSFEVSADISVLTRKHGPGIYSLMTWGRPDHMSESTVISKQAIFWGIDPPEGNPYSATTPVQAETAHPAPTRETPALIQFPTTVPPVMIQAATPPPPLAPAVGPTPFVITTTMAATPAPLAPARPTTTPIPRYVAQQWAGGQQSIEVPWGWVGTSGFRGDFTFGNPGRTAGVEARVELWEETRNGWTNFLQERLDKLLAEARQALRAGVDNPYKQKSSGPAGTDNLPEAGRLEYLMQEQNDQCVRDIVEILAPSADHSRGVRVTAWVCQENLDDRRREDREHMLRNFR